jgi:N-acetylneuraminate synthase
VDFLEAMDVPGYKVASFEVVDIPLLERIGRTHKPVIMSTGMASLGEIEAAIEALRESGCPSVALLRCTSAYPAPLEEMNLRSIPHMEAAFGVPVGLSDHTMGITAPVVAVALGARIIEKHLTLSRADGGPDAGFSLEPGEFKAMAQAVREAEKCLGRICYQPTEHERESRIYRRSLFAVEDIPKGEVITGKNVRSIRPGHGMAPKRLGEVLGRRAARDIARGTPLEWGLLS